MTRHPARFSSRRRAHGRRADRLRPLRVEDADEMLAVLADQELDRYIGCEPPTTQELHTQYMSSVGGGSADGRERWLNWVVLPGGR